MECTLLRVATRSFARSLVEGGSFDCTRAERFSRVMWITQGSSLVENLWTQALALDDAFGQFLDGDGPADRALSPEAHGLDRDPEPVSHLRNPPGYLYCVGKGRISTDAVFTHFPIRLKQHLGEVKHRLVAPHRRTKVCLEM